MICFTYNLHLAVMSAETEPGPNLNSLKFKALRTIRDLFYPTLELRIVGLSLVFLSLAISAETPEDIIYQFAPGVVVVLCIVFSTWLEMFSNYVKDMELRPSVSSGLHYGMMLVPLVITALIQNASHDPSTVVNRRYIAYLQFYLLAMSIFGLVALIYTMIHRVSKPPNSITLIVIVIAVLTLVAYNVFPIKEGLLSMVSLLILCTLSLVVLIDSFPYTFSAGEAIIVAESIGILLFDSIYMVLHKYDVLTQPSFMNVSKTQVSICVQIFLAFTILFIVTLSPVWYAMRHGFNSTPLKLFTVSTLMFSILFVGSPILTSFLGMNPILWFLEKFLFSNTTRPTMVVYMGALTLVSILIGIYFIHYSRMDIVTRRKVFHLISVFIYTPSLLYDLDTISLASSVAVCCLILLELYHNLQIGPFSAKIHTYMHELSGRDSNQVANTGLYLNHIYLILGLSLPCWLLPVHRGSRLFVYAGVLSLGVLDAFAAIFGKRFGRRRWFNNGKSVEGMLVGFFAAASAIFLITSLDRGLAPFSLKIRPYRLARTLLGLSMSSLIECITSQHDNLILSPFFFSLLTVVERKQFFFWF